MITVVEIIRMIVRYTSLSLWYNLYAIKITIERSFDVLTKV